MSFFKVSKSSFYSEHSLLKVASIVSWKKEKKAYNFVQLPSIAIIATKKNVFSKQVTPFTKRIKGISGIHYNYKSKYLFCSEFGMGSSALIALLEELKELGVQRFIFIGVAGMLDSTVKEGNAYEISSVFSSSGSSYFYTTDEKIESANTKWFNTIKKQCQLETRIAWSTDCPYRETASLLEYFKSKNCSLVEMESAGIYAFSQFYKVPAVVILVGADSLITSQWIAPKNTNNLLKAQQNLVSKLLKL